MCTIYLVPTKMQTYRSRRSPTSNADTAQTPAALTRTTRPGCLCSPQETRELCRTGHQWGHLLLGEPSHEMGRFSTNEHSVLRQHARERLRSGALAACATAARSNKVLCYSCAWFMICFLLPAQFPGASGARGSCSSKSGDQQSQSLSSLHAARAAEATCTDIKEFRSPLPGKAWRLNKQTWHTEIRH